MFLFTHIEFIDTLWKYGPFVFVLFTFFYNRYTGSSKDEQAKAKKERDVMCERIENLESVQKLGYPKFRELLEDFKLVKTRVHNDHETRFTGIIGNLELFSKLYDNKLDNASKRVDDLEKRLDKIDTKLDNIMNEIMKINTYK